MMHPCAVSLRIGHVAAIVALLAAIGAGVSCTADAEQPIEPSRHDLGEPWQAEPFAINETVLANADRACRDLDPPPGVSLAVVDARGDSTVYLVYTGLTAQAECLVSIKPTGQAETTGGGASIGGLPPVPVPGEVSVVSSGSTGGGVGQDVTSTVLGRAGAGVERVEVRLRNNRTITASLGPTGWFAAWWPSDEGYLTVAGFDGLGNLTGTAQ